MGAVFTICGYLALFTPLFDSLKKRLACKFSAPCQAMLGVIILVAVYLVCCVICAIFTLVRSKYSILKINGNHNVYVQYGDIFSEKTVDNPAERRNVVIPMNRCFDTIVDNDLVSMKTLHGQAM